MVDVGEAQAAGDRFQRFAEDEHVLGLIDAELGVGVQRCGAGVGTEAMRERGGTDAEDGGEFVECDGAVDLSAEDFQHAVGEGGLDGRRIGGVADREMAGVDGRGGEQQVGEREKCRLNACVGG